MKRFILCVFLIFISVSLLTASKGEEKQTTGIKVVVDPRVELFSTICRLAGYHEYNYNQLPVYVNDVEAYFKPYVDHEAVKYARLLKSFNSMGYNAPMGLAVHVSDAVSLKEIIPLDPLPEEMDDRWTPKTAREFLKKARQFVKDTKFQTFIEKHKEIYDLSVSRMENLLQDYKVVEWFNSYFGKKSASTFTVILGMQNGGPSYGPRIRLKDGTDKVYAIIGLWLKDEKGFPKFEKGFLGTVIHEFCHSFANPLVDKYASELEESGKKIFPHVAEEMKSMAYGTWQTMMYESLVRACTSRYYHAVEGVDKAKKIVRSEIENNFLWMEGLTGVLSDYEAQRDKYPTLDAYFPVIIDFFNKYAPGMEKAIAKRKEEKRVKMEALKAKAPKIVAMVPENGAQDVDPGLKEIKITFDRPMMDKAWAVMQLGSSEHHIKTVGDVFYDSTRTVFTIPVELKPDWNYKFGLNHEKYLAFMDENKNPLMPVVYTFKTRKKEKEFTCSESFQEIMYNRAFITFL